MKRIVVILIAIGIHLFTIFSLIFFNIPYTFNSPTASNGLINLNDWEFAEQGLVKLGGEWEYYPSVLIVPEKGRDVFKDYQQIKEYRTIPSLLQHRSYQSDDLYTVATYRLIINVPKDATFARIVE